MRGPTLTFHFTPDQLARVDQLAARSGLSREECVRLVIAEAMRCSMDAYIPASVRGAGQGEPKGVLGNEERAAD